MRRRLRIVQGGARAGKTDGILLLLINYAQYNKDLVISVVSESVPHLKRGVMRDFLEILKGHDFYVDKQWNKTDFIYSFPDGSIIEFFSADMPDKVRGPSRHILFLNEANNISYETYQQLALRTSEFIYIDYNPVSEFWVHEEIMSRDNKDKVEYDFDIITYTDNEMIPEEIKKEIESHRDNKNFWLVYGLGQLGEAEGKIYRDWKTIDKIPHEARLERYGLDFGYSIDPTSIIGIYYYDGGYILNEELYQKGMSNKQIADFINNRDKAMVVADSAEPKSIDEIKSYGINIIPSQKGQGSVNQGIQYVQQQRISMTKRSLNTIKEYRNYLWKTDKDGNILNVPDLGFNHSMDAIRYGMESLKEPGRELQQVGTQPGLGGAELPVYKF